ncbi:TonB-dependent receptor [Saccharibacter sp. 17.LH.SD]|uniref:TonB-dependent receptor plug domain-containing protein n=1 Tax=Saccharibacter sp. 17.LH.SD TaxID=2689393 RepID=UPI001368E4ED|nr:TonB-dependent receptor [Saccharibacter sp. 17.LH.SD]MXV43971.1 TonB-dependent receptor [Saccharibacter sp. 17.LH.SD]
MRRLRGVVAVPVALALFPSAYAMPLHASINTHNNKNKIHRPTTLKKKKHPRTSLDAHSAEHMVVTRNSSILRRARASISPVDIISAKELHRTGQINLADALARVNPSVTIGMAGWDAGAFTSSIRLRGLNPNHTLVLINGKRRHTTASIYADSGPQEGSSPVDLNMIPAEAIDHIEVLRDGSGSEYGADAIAGVINIVLKKTTNKLEADAQTGANAYNGDGWQYQFGFDGGLPLGNDGYINLSGQMYHTDHFIQKGIDDRTGKEDDPALSLAEETRQTTSLNFGKNITPSLQLYGLATYAHRHGESLQDYRTPHILPQLYPDGFVPIEALEEQDYAFTLGLKGHFWGGFRWDLSSTYGADDDHMSLKNSGNPALYEATGYTPTRVRTETFRHAQWTNDLAIRRHFSLNNEQKIDLSFGAQHRLDTYRIGAGDPASYLDGGTQGFAGLMPENAGKWDRDVWSGYVDTNIHITRKLNIDLGGRYEHYTDVGNSQTGKVAVRYDFNRRIAVRATLNNGFRAPTLLEEHYSALNVTPFGASANLPVNSTAASSLGARPLKPERSTNLSGGFVLEPIDHLHVTIDAYQINIRDRIVPGGSYQGENAENAIGLTGATLPGGLDPQNVTAAYFTNGASTRTQGLDIMASYPLHLHRYGNLDLSLALNLNRTRIHHIATDGNGNPQLNAQQIGYLTTASPRSKIILNAYWTIGKWNVNVRQTRYGQTTSNLTYEDSAPANLQYSQTQFRHFVNPPAWLTDLEVGYQATRRIHVAVGANNIFNVRPRRTPPENSYLGTLHYDNNSSGIPMTGGYYYGRINISL